MYLPFHLKRCFSVCAAYRKDYNFKKAILAEIWVAEGFVEPQGNIPLQHTGEQYFDDLVNLSFFQKLRGKYVIHDLMHDMALLVSKDECFIVKNTSEIEKVPPNVRHLSILSSGGVKCSDLIGLVKHRKLRTLLCDKYFRSEMLSSLMDRWFDELGCLRVFICAFKMEQIPERIGNLKHLRYLGISRNCHFNVVPSSFWSLYNLQFLYARKCTFGRSDISASKLINLRKFESCILGIKVDAVKLVEQIGYINKFSGKKDLVIYNLGAISMDHAAKVELRKRKDVNSLTLSWFSFRSHEHNETEVLQALQPPTNVESVHIEGYPGDCFPTWFPDSDGLSAMPFSGTILSSVTKLSIERCLNLSDCTLQPNCIPGIKKIEIRDCTSVKSVQIEQFEGSTSLEELKVYNCPNITYLLAPLIRKFELKNSESLGDSNGCSSLTISSSLRELSIEGCQNLSDCELDIPAIKKIEIAHCRNIKSVRIDHLEDSTSLEELKVYNCPNITHHLLAPFIRKLELKNSGNLEDSIDYSSLTILHLSCDHLTSIDLQKWSLPLVQELKIRNCPCLRSIRDSEQVPPTDRARRSSTGKFPFLSHLTIEYCYKLETADGLLPHEYLSAIKELTIWSCPLLNRQSGTMLPSSVQKLDLSCGNLSHTSLGNLGDSINYSFLAILHLSCDHLTSIDLQKWSLPLLEVLKIRSCRCLISVRDSEKAQVPTDLSLGWARRRSTGKFPFLTHLTIEYCNALETVDDLLTHECLPAIKDLTIWCCPRLNWQNGTMFPSSLQRLKLQYCGNIPPSSLGSLTSTCLQELSG